MVNVSSCDVKLSETRTKWELLCTGFTTPLSIPVNRWLDTDCVSLSLTKVEEEVKTGLESCLVTFLERLARSVSVNPTNT